MGKTPAAYLQQLRLGEAEGLLRDTHLPLREVALRSGFYSARHLMRTFQRVHGRSPSRLRKNPGRDVIGEQSRPKDAARGRPRRGRR
jgi:transcriptional regulator GlxA family with amidase domain